MTEPDASNRVRPMLPRGLVDRSGADIAAAEAMMAKIRATYALYGFEAVETPFIEYTDALGKFLPDQDRPNEGVFSFRDDDEQWLSLRYDLTAPLARYVAEHYDRLPKPYRSYRAGWVFRNEKPGPGRYRQFMQFDADTVGAAGVAADAEICMMAADCLEALGVQRGDYVIKFNSRKLLDALLSAIGVGMNSDPVRHLQVMRSLDKYDRLGIAGVRALLGGGRRDESGDFTKGANLGDDQINDLLQLFTIQHQPDDHRTGSADRDQEDAAFVSSHFDRELGGLVSRVSSLREDDGYLPISNHRTIDLLRAWLPPTDEIGNALDELAEISSLVRAAQYGSRRIRFDPSVVRGLEYYTGPVFEAELTFETPGEDGKPVRFGSVGGGGRYDGLVARFRAEPVPATGFSIGVSRLLAALRAIKSPIVAAIECAGSGRRARARPRRGVDGEHPAPRRILARRRNRRRALSRRGRHERAAQICGQARQPLRRHPGLERARRAGRPAGDDPRSQAGGRTRQGDQGPRRLSRASPARSISRARGRTRRARPRSAGAGVGRL